MKRQSNFLYFLTCSSFLLFTDIYFSNLITLKIAQGWQFLTPFLKIIYAENTGAAFSILQNSTNFLILLSVIAVLIILFFVFKNKETIKKKELFLISFLTAGILGNLYERIFLGYVRDFFDLQFINFPIFNISDIFINIGIFGIIILILLSKKPVKIL